ncbi:uncharacterized protein PV09_02230 [Verruconis gallopava]|uniref:TIGR00267 family protein n=1 Tax=Verruconis gallopava TaxID=253628 RepID=A0A0D1Z365_9PEZI|nr:uncharacterized protein PV09_02230 [Verruconis gallopava]KIW07387.1 hypothetical protein PV09_02230 [Verruconis gallopava]
MANYVCRSGGTRANHPQDEEQSSHVERLSSSTSSVTVTPSPAHTEKHNNHSSQLSNAIIGFADGLTVPFALTAGLTAVGSIHLVIVGGLAELFAGAISMGLGAWLAAETERKHYEIEEAREIREVREMPAKEEDEIYEIFEQYAIGRSAAKGVVEALKVNEDMWVKFMMDFELKLEKPDVSKCWISALVMGMSYLMGGLIPMLPYFFMKKVNDALFISIGISVVILLVFGYVKAIFTGTDRKTAVLSAVQTLFVGALAAGTSYGIVRGINDRLGGTSIQ